MALPLALPLAPVISSGASAAAATFIAGSSLSLAKDLSAFRRSAPPLPPLTGLEGAATLTEKVADYLAGARVPVGFPVPPPWDPRATALGLAASALGLWGALRNGGAQLWGRLGGSVRTPAPAPIPTTGLVNPLTGSYSPTSQNTITVGAGSLWSGKGYGFGQQCVPTTTPPANSFSFTRNGPLEFRVRGVDPINVCGGGFVQLVAEVKSGTNAWEQFASVGGGSTEWQSFLGQISIATAASDAVSPLPPMIQPLPSRGDLSDLFQPATLPQLAPLPGVAIAPATTAVPGAVRVVVLVGDPALQVRPGDVQVPTLPRPIIFLPGAPATAEPTRPATGELSAPAPAPVPPTPPDVIFPIPNRPPITANGPRGTNAEIAKELGRIEQKLELMLRAGGEDGGLPDWLQVVGSLAKAIFDALTDGAPEGNYSLSSPCELDEDEERIVEEVPFPATSDNFSRLQVRIDALAELLQVHKDLKQPNCKPKQPQGEFVTVNFEQID
jgi:hypothetical protein